MTPEEIRDQQCFVAIRGGQKCKSDDIKFLTSLEVDKKAAWSSLNRHWNRMTPEVNLLQFTAKYAIAQNFIQLSHNLTSDCLLISVYLPVLA